MPKSDDPVLTATLKAANLLAAVTQVKNLAENSEKQVEALTNLTSNLENDKLLDLDSQFEQLAIQLTEVKGRCKAMQATVKDLQSTRLPRLRQDCGALLRVCKNLLDESNRLEQIRKQAQDGNLGDRETIERMIKQLEAEILQVNFVFAAFSTVLKSVNDVEESCTKLKADREEPETAATKEAERKSRNGRAVAGLLAALAAIGTGVAAVRAVPTGGATLLFVGVGIGAAAAAGSAGGAAAAGVSAHKGARDPSNPAAEPSSQAAPLESQLKEIRSVNEKLTADEECAQALSDALRFALRY